MNEPEVGKDYKHFKGGKYKVRALALHTETEQTMVVYQSHNTLQFFVRPLKGEGGWMEPKNGKPRFKEIT